MSYLESMFQLGLHSAVPSQGAFEGLPNRAPCPGEQCALGPLGKALLFLGLSSRMLTRKGASAPGSLWSANNLALAAEPPPGRESLQQAPRQPQTWEAQGRASSAQVQSKQGSQAPASTWHCPPTHLLLLLPTPETGLPTTGETNNRLPEASECQINTDSFF